MTYFAEENENTDFTVSWTNNDEEVQSEMHNKFCETRDESNLLAEKRMKNYRKVWIGARVEYENTVGSWHRGWLWVWWTSATEWGPVPDSGWGIPDTFQYLARYR
jgi:hypothetical protein